MKSIIRLILKFNGKMIQLFFYEQKENDTLDSNI